MVRSAVAERIGGIPFAGIRKVFEKATRLESEGRKVIHFEIGRPDFDTPAHIKEAAVQALARGMVHYTPTAGTAALRAAFSRYILQHKGVLYDPEAEIMVTAGGQEALYLSIQALINPGDEVLVSDPGYSQFYTSVRLAGGIPMPMPLLEDHDFGLDLEAARALLTGRTKAIMVNSPHNPTGGVMDSHRIREVCEFARRHDLLLFSDEAYDRILYEGNDFLSPASVPDMKERTIVCGSLSKTYAMTGWRIGYLAAPSEFISATIKMQQSVILSVCSFAQAGALAALGGAQDCVDAMVAEFARRRRIILDGIAGSPGLSVQTEPLGAFYVFARVDVPGRSTFDVANGLLDQEGVAVVPGLAFGTRGEGYVRISYAASQEDCREGMERIARYMRSL